jgi:hypothetical protein
MNVPSLTEIRRNPEWLPHTYDKEGSNLVFVKVTQSAHQALPFLNTEELRHGFEYASVPVGPLASGAASQPNGALHFIFHTAFCCSTLLVNALASTGRVVGMKEPAVFLNLVHRFMRGESFDTTKRLDLVLRLLSRPFEGTSGTVAKPSCFANPLLPHVLKAAPSSRAILLHSDITTFLYAVAKRGQVGRDWARSVYESCLRYIPIEAATDAQLGATSDLEAAGLAWLLRRDQFNQVALQLGPSRVMQIDGERLIHSADHLRSALVFFDIDGTVSSSTFGRHSKTGQTYGPEHRTNERLQLEVQFGDEVETVSQRIQRLATELEIALD